MEVESEFNRNVSRLQLKEILIIVLVGSSLTIYVKCRDGLCLSRSGEDDAEIERSGPETQNRSSSVKS